jgi:dihydroxyacetone kinase
MGMQVADIAGAVRRAHEAMAHLEQVLNEADSKLGDGDTGSMLARVINRLAMVDLSAQTDVGEAYYGLAMAAAAATGSSLGTLLSAALMTMGKKTRGKSEVEWSTVSELFAAARDDMMARGGANLGDKTVLDGLEAVVTATAAVGDSKAIAAASVKAAGDALTRFRGVPCRIGRARMYAEQSLELDDPGMLAFARLTAAIAGQSPPGA